LDKVTPEQIDRIVNLILRVNVTEEAIQKTLIERFDLIETMMKHPEAVKAITPSLFEAFILSGIHPQGMVFQESPQGKAEDEIVIEYDYPAGWCLKSVEQQLSVLNDFFPALALKAEAPGHLPAGAEGWLLVPKPSRVASTYHEALEKILSLTTGAGVGFLNSREGKLGPEYLRLVARTSQVLDKLESSTAGDYLVLAAQCGRRHRAKSVFQVRNSFHENEYGLGPFEITSLLLTHPERLTDYEHLGIDCPGCEYATNTGGNFSYSLSFSWGDEGLYFDCSATDGIAPGFGSASGFLG